VIDGYLSRRLTIPSLILSNYIAAIPQLVISLLLVEIALSFNVEVGIAGQLGTTQSIASAIMALLMGVLSVKFRHKSLLLVGMASASVAALGCYVSPSFVLLLAMIAVTGISIAMMRPMSQALTGNLFTVQERPKVIGYLTAGGAISYIIGPPIIAALTEWRLAFLFFMFPLSLLGLGFAFMGIPSTSRSTSSTQHFFQGFQAVFQHKSAIACVVANVLFTIAFKVVNFYGIPFYRQVFAVDATTMSLIISGATVGYVISSVLGGRLVNRFGRKPITVLSVLSTGVLTVAFLNVPSLWLSLGLWFMSGITTGIGYAAYNSLALEQVPGYRGTMMSLSEFSFNFATAVSNGVGGVILIAFDYGTMGGLGITAIIAAIIFHVFTIDPTLAS
jgi:predicted MFS family arabinose efflux permease